MTRRFPGALGAWLWSAPGRARARLAALARRSRAAPGRTGLGLFLGMSVALALAQALARRVPFGGSGRLDDLLVAWLHVALVAFLAGAYLAVVRRAEASYAQLRPMASKTAGVCCLPPYGPAPRAWYFWLLAGLCFAIAGPELTEPGRVANPLQWWWPPDWAPETVWHRLLGLIVGGGLGLFGFAIVHVSSQLGTLAASLREIDLFTTSSVRPFLEQSLTNGLLVAGLLSLLGLFAFDQGVSPMLMAAAAFALSLVAVSVLLPLAGVRRRIRQEKQSELAWIDVELARERLHLHQATPGHGGRLADLLAHRAAVTAVREWPFDNPATRTLALYFLLPVASWFAGAVIGAIVERWLAPALG